MNRTLSHCGALLLVISLLVGCGSQGEGATATTSPPASATAPPTTTVAPTPSRVAQASVTSRVVATPSSATTRRITLAINDAQIDTTNPAAGGVMVFVRVRNETSTPITIRLADFRVRDSNNYVYRPNEQWSTTATTTNGGKEFKNGEASLEGREIAAIVLWVPEAQRSSGLQLTYLPDSEIALPFTPRGGTP